MEKSETNDNFWEEIEKDIGEKIIWSCLGENLLPIGTLKKNSVGVCFLTDTKFFFHTYPKKDFFAVLAGSFRRKKKGKEDKRIEFVVPREELIVPNPEQAERGMKRFSISRLALVDLKVEPAEGREEPAAPMDLRFSLMSKEKAIELLQLLVKK
jgi:hypothetical protein